MPNVSAVEPVAEGILLRLWGKSEYPKKDSLRYHPLLYHMLDVGQVTLRLWQKAVPPILKAKVETDFGLTNIQMERLIVLLAAQHDLGKATLWQQKYIPLFAAVQEKLPVPDNPDDKPRHEFLSAALLEKYVPEGIGGWQSVGDDKVFIALILSRITGAHHGTVPGSSDLDFGTAQWGNDKWDELRHELLEAVRIALPGCEGDPVICKLLPKNPVLLPLLAGLISAADWIGSNKGYFDLASGTALADYTIRSAQLADAALQESGWLPRPEYAPAAPFHRVSGSDGLFSFAPNEMQKDVIKIADAATAPYLLLVEAAMGGGKTEAALYAADRALAGGYASGLYVAMPTQATGTALFERVLKDYLRFDEKTKRSERHPDAHLNIHLIHGGSDRNKIYDALRKPELQTPPDIENVGDTDADGNETHTGNVAAQEWFTNKKQALLAPLGVGTIDQALLGVLQTKHWFVRLFGLAGKVVVFDEVHAYDVYMGELLQNLVRWLRILGCTVILLSATLPADKRRALVAAWTGDEDTPLENVPYPRITHVGESGTPTAKTITEAVEGDKNARTVYVEYAPKDLALLLVRMQIDLPDGGVASLICNTVARAQEAYKLAKEMPGFGDWDVTLFHARTLSLWRSEQEQAVLQKFGKYGTRVNGERPPKALLISTQVAEQSLDWDADWMASEIAPVDLLLQRMGRLHRHRRDGGENEDGTRRDVRPIQKATFVVLCGEAADGTPDFPAYSDIVYDRYILLRTRIAFTQEIVTLPDDIETLVTAVYDAPELGGKWDGILRDARLKRESQLIEDSNKADLVMVMTPDYSPSEMCEAGSQAGQTHLLLRDDDDPQTHKSVRAVTRLGDPSITLICTGTDADGQSLAVLPYGEPKTEERNRLLDHSVSVSSKTLYYALLKQEPPVAWKKVAGLRFCRHLHFDNGVCAVGNVVICLSKELGLESGKE